MRHFAKYAAHTKTAVSKRLYTCYLLSVNENVDPRPKALRTVIFS